MCRSIWRTQKQQHKVATLTYTFSIDKGAVASMQIEGNYCYLTGKSAGIAKITVRHSASSWPYSCIVICDADLTKVPYLTTKQNIINLNMTKGEKGTIEVEMPNAPYTTYRDDLAISVVDKDGSTMRDPIVQTVLTRGKIEVTPLKEGSCFIRIHHDSATYDLDVRCRVTTEIDTAHIELSAKDVTVTTADSQTVTAHIEGLPQGTVVDPDKYEWTFSDSASGLIDYAISGGGETGKGDSIFITGKGKRSGAVKVTVEHPQAGLPKSFIVFAKNAAGEVG